MTWEKIRAKGIEAFVPYEDAGLVAVVAVVVVMLEAI